jgi:hypothetical protein
MSSPGPGPPEQSEVTTLSFLMLVPLENPKQIISVCAKKKMSPTVYGKRVWINLCFGDTPDGNDLAYDLG